MLIVLVISILGVHGGDNGLLNGQGEDVSQMLKTMEERVNESIDKLRSENQLLKNRVAYLESRTDAEKPEAIFSVRFREGQISGILDHETLKFDEIVSNVGLGYHTENGTFHAPVSGYYMFFISVYPKTTRVQVCVHVENIDLFCAAGNDVSEQGANMAIVHLDAGHHARVQKLWGDNNFYGTHWTTFSGFLISEGDAVDHTTTEHEIHIIG